MSDFPKNLEDTIVKISRKYGLRFSKNTHYETENRVLSWFEGNVLKRIDFTLMNSKVIEVTFLINTYPRFLPRLFKWLGHQIFFPSVGKVRWEDYGELDTTETANYYEEKVTLFIQQTKGLR